MKNRKWFALLSVVVAVTSIPLPSYGAWVQDGTLWQYESDFGQSEINTWKLIDNTWYYFDDFGYMVTGWQQIADKWYFFNPVSDGSKGQMLIGWQWIDGKCYYLSLESTANYPAGAMYQDTVTPDGYLVEGSGAWMTESGVVQYEAGKGIQTTSSATTKTTKFSSSGGSGGGGSSGGSKSGTKSSSGDSQKEETTATDPEVIESPSNSQPGDSQEEEQEENNPEVIASPSDANSGDSQEEEEAEKETYSFTIRYLDIKDKTVLHVLTAQAEAESKVEIEYPDMEGYEICQGQKESFILASDEIVINIYYSQVEAASPSEAKKVSWKLYFVEEDNHSNEILKSQSGNTIEGTELVIDFPEAILGTDQYYYHSLVSSPWSKVVSGTGTQKYYIEFEKGESLPKEEDPDQEARDTLEEWLTTVRTSDFEITGETPMDSQIITNSLEESNERLLNLVSMADGTDRKEIYLIAKNHIPSTVTISQAFDDVINISELVMDEFEISGQAYTVIRVGFEKTYEEETCVHNYLVVDRADPTCTEAGYETVRCSKCGKEETYLLPATGHTDTDGDGICDICYEPADEDPEAVHYQIGDIQARNIGGRIYLFRCIDDDYEDAMDNSRQTALFLCDSVIRSDISGVANKLTFGTNNNYKRSNIREWLQDNAEDDRFLENTYIGITRSYMGVTVAGTYEQFDESSLTGYDRLYQSMEDKIFILSVEEAVKYRDYLWKFNGSEENNPESQVSAYSKGYYLRTPQDTGAAEFQYGTGIYAVSLTSGNIRPVEVTDTSMGIRPVMAIPQG